MYWASGPLTLQLNENTTYYFQAYYLNAWWGWSFTFNLYPTPPPNADFYSWPSDPSVYDNIQFNNYSNDPGGASFQSSTWDFGDGTTATDWNPFHQFATDGDYTVQLTVVTSDGRTGTTSRLVQVRTHDIAITKFTVPQSASAGQTRQVNVEVNNHRYSETVTIQLYKSTQGGFVLVGTLTQYVPVRPSNRTTQFAFNYTFTNGDAAAGKVTFKAVANLEGARDSWPADNEAIALPTKVTR